VVVCYPLRLSGATGTHRKDDRLAEQLRSDNEAAVTSWMNALTTAERSACWRESEMSTNFRGQV